MVANRSASDGDESGRIKTSIRIHLDVYRALGTESTHSGKSISELIEHHVHQHLKDNPPTIHMGGREVPYEIPPIPPWPEKVYQTQKRKEEGKKT